MSLKKDDPPCEQVFMTTNDVYIDKREYYEAMVYWVQSADLDLFNKFIEVDPQAVSQQSHTWIKVNEEIKHRIGLLNGPNRNTVIKAWLAKREM